MSTDTIQEIASARLPIRKLGEFLIRVFRDSSNLEHVVIQKGEITETMLVRLHSACLTGDIFASGRCDCGWQLNTALKMISEKNGLLLYLQQEGRGIGLANKIKAYALQDRGMDTIAANQSLGFANDLRDYVVGAKILHYLGIKKVNLLTNNPHKIAELERNGIIFIVRIPLDMQAEPDNYFYLKTKQERMGHLLEGVLHYTNSKE